MSWRIRGSYFESCNCEAICPCRTIDGVPGGRSTYGECLGVLSWMIEEGRVDGVALDGLAVALAESAQRDALAGIYTGRLGGDALKHFPWAWKDSVQVALRPAQIEVSHEPRRQWLRIRDHVSLRIRDAYAGSERVTCVIPGHEESGEELVADELSVDDGPLRFEFRGNCGYAARFDYAG